LEPFGGQARARDRRPAPERLELRVVNHARGRVHLDLQLHHIPAFGRADQTGPDIGILFGQRSDVARVLVVVDNLVRICHLSVLPFATALWTDPRPLSPARRAATSRAGACRRSATWLPRK